RPISEHQLNRLLGMPRAVFRDFRATLRHGLSNAGQLLAYPLRNPAELLASLAHRLRRRSNQRPRWWTAGVAAPTFALLSRTVEPTEGQCQKVASRCAQPGLFHKYGGRSRPRMERGSPQ